MKNKTFYEKNLVFVIKKVPRRRIFRITKTTATNTNRKIIGEIND